MFCALLAMKHRVSVYAEIRDETHGITNEIHAVKKFTTLLVNASCKGSKVKSKKLKQYNCQRSKLALACVYAHRVV